MATAQDRIAELNALLRDPKRRPRGEALTSAQAELDRLLNGGGVTGPASAALRVTDEPTATARATELRQALRGRLSGPDRQKMGQELAALLIDHPDAGDAELAASNRKDFSVLAEGDGLSPKTIELTERLRAMPRHGSDDRRAVLTELEHELTQPPSGVGSA